MVPRRFWTRNLRPIHLNGKSAAYFFYRGFQIRDVRINSIEMGRKVQILDADSMLENPSYELDYEPLGYVQRTDFRRGYRIECTPTTAVIPLPFFGIKIPRVSIDAVEFFDAVFHRMLISILDVVSASKI